MDNGTLGIILGIGGFVLAVAGTLIWKLVIKGGDGE